MERKMIEELIKARRCREMIRKDNLSDDEKRKLQNQMQKTLNAMRKIA